MIIEYGEDEFVVEDERVIDGEFHRVVRFDTGYYGIQSKNYKGEWETWLISPKQNVREMMSVDEIREMEKEKDFFIVAFESFMGRADLLGVLEAYKDSYKLKNGEYWSLELSVEGSDKAMTEIIRKVEGEGLLSSMEDMNKLWLPKHDTDSDNMLFKGVLIIIIVSIILLSLVKLFGR